MDTHITATPDFDRIDTPLGPPLGIPGELGASTGPGGRRGAPDEAPSPDPAPVKSDEQPASRRQFRRKGLLATAAFGTVVLAAAGGAAWWYRPDLMAFDLRHVELPAFLQRGPGPPAPLPAEVGVQPGAAAITQARRPEAAPAPAALRPQVSEFAALQFFPGNPPVEVGVSAPTPSPTTGPREPVPRSPAPTERPAASPPVPAAQSESTVGPVAGATATTDAAPTPGIAADRPPGAPPAAADVSAVAAPAALRPLPAAPEVNAPVPAPTPAATSALPARNPLIVAAELRAAPLSQQEQIQVVGLVKELGAQLRDTRTEVAQLRATVAQLLERVETKTTEFENRLGLAEAGTVLAASARAGHPETHGPVSSATPAFRTVSAGRAVSQPVPAPVTPAASASRTVKDYRIQGASPGLAVLSVLNPALGGPTVIEVATGSEVPGVGRIKAIFQRGTAWVVQTDAGVIQ